MLGSRKLMLIFITINFSLISNAQISDTARFVSYENKIMVKVNLDTQTEEFILIDANDQAYDLALNNKTKLSLSLDYKFISTSISFTPKFLPGNDDEKLKGKSSFTDFKFSFFPGRFIQTLHYKRLKGFYLKNTRELLTDWQQGQDAYIQFPSLTSQSFGGSTSFVFNPDLSLKSLLYQREWQKYSEGSFVPSVNYNLTFLTDDFGTFKGKERELDFSLDLSYYYNWVITDRLIIAPYAFTGSGIRFLKYREKGDEINSEEKDKYFTYEYGAGLHLGYNSEKFLFGGKLNYRYSTTSNKTLTNSKTIHYMD